MTITEIYYFQFIFGFGWYGLVLTHAIINEYIYNNKHCEQLRSSENIYLSTVNHRVNTRGVYYKNGILGEAYRGGVGYVYRMTGLMSATGSGFAQKKYGITGFGYPIPPPPPIRQWHLNDR